MPTIDTKREKETHKNNFLQNIENFFTTHARKKVALLSNMLEKTKIKITHNFVGKTLLFLK